MKIGNGNVVKVILAGLLIVGINGIVQADLISNGSFELGTFSPIQPDNGMQVDVGSTAITDWAVTGHNVAWGKTPAWGLLAASDGDLFIDLTGWYDHAAPAGGVSQTIATIAGQAYTLSFDLVAYNADYPVSVSAVAGGTSDSFNWDGDFNEWRRFSLDFIADSANTVISILGTGVASDVWYIGLDNVSVESTIAPVPGAAFLGMLGLGAAGAKLRKRRSA